MKFHLYLKELRERKYNNISKLCKILKIEYQMWRKIERGINPPPRRSVLVKFCQIVHAKEYEKSQLFALAKRWEPHPDTNTLRHNLFHKGLGVDWSEAIRKENIPDYNHIYWKS